MHVTVQSAASHKREDAGSGVPLLAPWLRQQGRLLCPGREPFLVPDSNSFVGKTLCTRAVRAIGARFLAAEAWMGRGMR